MTQLPDVDTGASTETPRELTRLAALATEAGLPALAAQAWREVERLADGRFHLSVRRPLQAWQVARRPGALSRAILDGAELEGEDSCQNLTFAKEGRPW